MKHTNIRGTENWWLGMQRIVVKTHTDLRNNAIKNMQMKFKGEELKLMYFAKFALLYEFWCAILSENACKHQNTSFECMAVQW